MACGLSAKRDSSQLECSPTTADLAVSERKGEDEPAAPVLEVQGRSSSVGKSKLLLDPRLIAGETEIVHDLQL